jgi:outer membrane protein W
LNKTKTAVAVLAAALPAQAQDSRGWQVNLDLKKLKPETEVYAGTATAGTFKVNPTLISLGFGKRF